MVQWLRLGAPNAGSPGSTPGQGTRSCMLQLKILCATTKIQQSQILKKEKKIFKDNYQNVNNTGIRAFIVPWDFLCFPSGLTIKIYYQDNQKINYCLKIKGLKILQKIKRNYALTLKGVTLTRPFIPFSLHALILPQLVPQHPRTDSTSSLGYHAGKTGKKIIFTFTSWAVLIIMLKA